MTWKGGKLNSVTPSHPLKYLGVHNRLEGKWTEEKTYALGKIRIATKVLRKQKLTRRQTQAYLEMCVYPLFSYSAPFVIWTDTELHRMDKLFVSCIHA